MELAGYYPRHHFTVAELAAMPTYERGTWAVEGWNRTTDDRGKPLAFYAPFRSCYLDGPNGTLKRVAVDKRPRCVVRPLVRVKAPGVYICPVIG